MVVVAAVVSVMQLKVVVLIYTNGCGNLLVEAGVSGVSVSGAVEPRIGLEQTQVGILTSFDQV